MNNRKGQLQVGILLLGITILFGAAAAIYIKTRPQSPVLVENNQATSTNSDVLSQIFSDTETTSTASPQENPIVEHQPISTPKPPITSTSSIQQPADTVIQGHPGELAVFPMQDDGTMVTYGGASDKSPLGDAVIVNNVAVLQKFYKSNPDNYDFIVVYSTIPTTAQAGSGVTVKNGIRGNGSFFPDLDETAKYGSKGKLQGSIFLPPNLGLDGSPSNGTIRSDVARMRYFLLHEISHHWLMFIGDIAECKTRPSFSVKCANPSTGFPVNSNGAHWDSNVDTAVRESGGIYEDPNGGAVRQYSMVNGKGYCSSASYTNSNDFRFNDLDLYLMGLMPPSETTALHWYEDLGSDFNEKLGTGGNLCAEHSITVADIINMEGARQPAYNLAQKNFNIAFIVLTAKGQVATQAQVAKVQSIAQEFPVVWQQATRGKSTVGVTQ